VSKFNTGSLQLGGNNVGKKLEIKSITLKAVQYRQDTVTFSLTHF